MSPPPVAVPPSVPVPGEGWVEGRKAISECVNFGRWLMRQSDRSDRIGDLSRAAAADERFPWLAGPLEMHDRVGTALADDMADAFGAALQEWHGAPYPLYLDRARRDADALARSHARSKAAMDAEVARLKLAGKAMDGVAWRADGETV